MAVWFITGAARGFGAAITAQVLSRGDRVVAAARRPESVGAGDPDRLLPVRLDVTSATDAAEAVRLAVDRFGRIDVLVNNAGRSLLGAVEEASADEVEDVFATNLFGPLTLTRAVLPVMRAQRSGTVINIGSMGGFAQSPGWGVYGATKFALEGVSEALSAEVAPLGIRVMIVELGSFRTDFLGGDSLRLTSHRIPDYASTVDPVRTASAARGGTQPNDPAKGAAALVDAATSPEPPLRLQLGRDAVARVARELDQVRAELDAWRSHSGTTDA